MSIGLATHDSSKMSTATTTGTSNPANAGITRRSGPATSDPKESSGPKENGSADVTEQLRRSFRKKYRHVEAIHSESHPSCLSHDTTETPSFLGFRNLMVIMLGEPGRPFKV